MSNILSPLTSVDFSASIAEITPYLENATINMMDNGWSQVDYILSDPQDLSETISVLAQLNATILNAVCMTIQGGNIRYQGARPNNCIILPLVTTGSVLNAYTAPMGATRYEDDPNRFYDENLTLIESESLDSPLLSGSEVSGAELVYSFQVPEGQLYKAILLFVNENIIPE
jgi:hypothetical protein